MLEHDRAQTSLRWFGFAATSYVWFDVFVYSATVLVLGPHFFPAHDPAAVTAASLASITVSLLFRPVGALLGGWLSDRLGRRPVAIFSLVAGGATALVAALPTVDVAGVWAAILLLLIRATQGIATGAMWPGLQLLVVESARPAHRGSSSAIAQAGVPGGLLLSSGTVALVTALVPAEAYAAWGWRLPYLVALLVVHMAWYAVHTGQPAESPVVVRLREAGLACSHPFTHTVRHDGARLAGTGVLVFAGQSVALVMVGAFVPSFVWDAGASQGSGAAARAAETGTTVGSPAGLPGSGVSAPGVSEAQAALGQTDGLLSVTFGAAVWLTAAIISGAVADRVGSTLVLLCAGVYTALVIYPFLVLISTPSLLSVYAGMLLLGLGLGGINGARGLWVAQRFRAAVRGTCVGLSTGLGMLVAGILIPPVVGIVRGNGAEPLWIATVLGACLLAGAVALWALRGREEPIEPDAPCPVCAGVPRVPRVPRRTRRPERAELSELPERPAPAERARRARRPVTTSGSGRPRPTRSSRRG